MALSDVKPVLVILAGGQSSRMGEPKGLLDFRGTPWILEQVSRFNLWSYAKVYIGLGYEAQDYLDEIPWFETAVHNFCEYETSQVRVFVNPNPSHGPFSTLQMVLSNITEVGPVLVLPIDVPLMNHRDLALFVKEKNEVVVPVFQGQTGHPVLLSSAFCSSLITLDPSSTTARLDTQIKKLETSKITKFQVKDDSVTLNLNFSRDWQKYKSMY
ncbi:nucleotidyltransferase family protein [Flavobacteriaceae bacterium F08102]|nr:nucleotidyltransferase family protein [Flavobacteriaceae bacterium F08102]